MYISKVHIQPITRLLHEFWQEANPCSMSSTPIRTLGEMINILVQDRGMHLLRVCEDTDIQKRQQESKE